MGWFGVEERGLALGIRQAAIPIGGVAAAATLPWLASAGGTQRAFEALGAGCVAGGLVAVAFMREAPAVERHGPADARPPLRDARMWLLAGRSSLYLTAQIATMGFVVLFLHGHRGLSAHAAAAVLAGTNILGIGARVGAGRWSDRVGAVGAARSGAALGFQQTMLAVLGAAVPPAFAVFVAATSWRVAFAVSAVGPLLGVLLLRRVPEPSRAAARARGTSAIPPAAP